MYSIFVPIFGPHFLPRSGQQAVSFKEKTAVDAAVVSAIVVDAAVLFVAAVTAAAINAA